ncbi:rifin [Plasmodium falciparum IGH-CR14]|uniref:Rifin n=1 Tax=Plasmodium falciparum IGH-CR14 TaxID=580059 RepID=A0A0L1I3G9_PLAFA|nr:rifin [Plasmodium falciparum IGH-CR14]
MKVHYINILLFALPLNILEHNKRNYNSTTLHAQTYRSLCECELYELANYDNDPQMKEVMENFIKQTQQRFHDYDDRMKEKRKQCKERCDKEIQKIILKDKLEKQMEQQLTTLQTDMQSDAIPICVCEKSIADKVEKGCLKCGGILGGGIAPGWGLVSGLWYAGWLSTAMASAEKAGVDAGIEVVIDTLKTLLTVNGVSDAEWKILVTAENYANEMLLSDLIRHLGSTLCGENSKDIGGSFCLFTTETKKLTQAINGHVPKAISEGTAEVVTVTKAEMEKVTTIGGAYSTGIIVSVVVIVIIVLVMIIIYLILRYRRKRKMTKKMQFMKLLKE